MAQGVPKYLSLVGKSLPIVDLFENTPTDKVNLGKDFFNKNIIVFGVQGAFIDEAEKVLKTYVVRANQLKRKRISEIFCVSVNDPFVMAAWGKEHGATGRIRMLADTRAAFTKAINLVKYILGIGRRSKCYYMVVKNGVITDIKVETNTGNISECLAFKIKV